MQRRVFWVILISSFLCACGKHTDTQENSSAPKTFEPVKEVEKLPTEKLRAGAQTMNDASKLGEQLQQRADENSENADKQVEQ